MTTFKTKDRWAHEVLDTLLEPDWRCSFSVVRWSCYLLWSYDTTKKTWAFTSFPSSALPCDENALVLVLVPQRAVGLVCQSVAAKAQTQKPPRYICTQLTAVHVYSDILWVRAVRGRSHTLHAYVPGCMASTLITSRWDHWLGSGHLGHAQTCSELQLYLAGLSSGFGSDKT